MTMVVRDRDQFQNKGSNRSTIMDFKTHGSSGLDPVNGGRWRLSKAYTKSSAMVVGSKSVGAVEIHELSLAWLIWVWRLRCGVAAEKMGLI